MIFLAGLMMAAFSLTLMAADAGGKKQKKGTLKHVVSFKFKESAAPADIKKVEEAFKGLKKKIGVIRSYDWGTNNSPEGLNKGFTHCFILTFDNDADRKTYLDHPDHKEFGKMLGPVLGDVYVIDFYSGK